MSPTLRVKVVAARSRQKGDKGNGKGNKNKNRNGPSGVIKGKPKTAQHNKGGQKLCPKYQLGTCPKKGGGK